MLIRFWCDSDITFSRGLHTNLVTVLYFFIINVFCLLNLYGAGGDASFAPQANLVFYLLSIHIRCACFIYFILYMYYVDKQGLGSGDNETFTFDIWAIPLGAISLLQSY